MIKLKLNEDHLKLIPFVLVQDENDDVLTINKHVFLTLQSHLLDDVAMILGVRDQAITSTLEDAEGIALPDELEKRCVDAYNYVRDNLYFITTLVFQFASKGGLTVGEYQADSRDLIFEKV